MTGALKAVGVVGTPHGQPDGFGVVRRCDLCYESKRELTYGCMLFNAAVSRAWFSAEITLSNQPVDVEGAESGKAINVLCLQVSSLPSMHECTCIERWA